MKGAASVVRTRELGPAFDLASAFDPAGGFLMEREGRGVAGAGEAIRVVVPSGERQVPRGADSVARALAGVSTSDGVALVAVGAFPFEPASEATLVVPSRAVVRPGRGVPREILVGEPSGPPASSGTTVATPSPAFDELRLRYVPTADAYAAAVATAVGKIRAGEIRKVVLARTLEVDAGRRLDAARLVRRLRAVDPSAYVFAVPMGSGAEAGMLVGASPELLVSRRGRDVRANPLAGSAPRSGDPEVDGSNARALAADPKNLEEHAIVVEAVAEVLEPLCDELTWDRTPTLLETANVWHLSTRFRGILSEPPPTALELVAALHPTPAVAGEPRAAALAVIRDLEPFERGCYGGPVGWVDANGDGEWAIALRCAWLRGDRAALYSGAGIVAGSDPEAEVDETDRKFRAFLDALRWG